jgi:hypothetical protein
MLFSSMRENFAQKLLRSGRFRRGKKSFRVIGFDDLSLIHKNDAVCNTPGKTHFMGHHHHRHAVASQVGHHLQYFVDHFRIQRGGGLVEEHDFRRHRERPSDGDPLLLAAGKIGREDLGFVGDPDPIEKRLSDFFRILFGEAFYFHRCQGDIAEHGHVRIEIERLKDHADVGAQPHGIEFGVAQRQAVDDDVAGLNRLEPVDAANQGAFATATRAADHDDISRLDGEINVLEDVKRAEPLIDLAKLDHDYRTRAPDKIAN